MTTALGGPQQSEKSQYQPRRFPVATRKPSTSCLDDYADGNDKAPQIECTFVET